MQILEPYKYAEDGEQMKGKIIMCILLLTTLSFPL